MSHCDVVTHVDNNTKKVYTVGGNVFQSVTQRRMNLAAKGLRFSMKQGEKDCARQSGAADAVEKEPCSMNDRDWFVILQMRPSSPKSTSALGGRR
jgi:hypothetical protein